MQSTPTVVAAQSQSASGRPEPAESEDEEQDNVEGDIVKDSVGRLETIPTIRLLDVAAASKATVRTEFSRSELNNEVPLAVLMAVFGRSTLGAGRRRLGPPTAAAADFAVPLPLRDDHDDGRFSAPPPRSAKTTDAFAR